MPELTLSRWLAGMRKYIRLQARRERRTHFGLAGGTRRVTAEFPAEIPAPAHSDPFMEPTTRQKMRRVVFRQIREFTPVKQKRRLIVRRLLRGEMTETIARELGFRPATARKEIQRARVFLGLKKRSTDRG